MSGTSRKIDPFHFDEIYKQAGVEDLFVKKTMGELKQKQSQAPMSSSSSVRPVAATTAPKASPNPSKFDLDFLTTLSTQGGTSTTILKQSSTSNLTAPAVQQRRQEAPKQAGFSAPDDPFALFEEVPGSAPPQKHVPRPGASATHGGLLDFDDFQVAAGPTQPSPQPLPQPVAAAPSSQSSITLPSQAPPPDYSDHAEHRTAPPGPISATRLAGSAETSAAGAPGTAPPAPPADRDYPSGHGSFMPIPDAAAAVALTDSRWQQVSHARAPPQAPMQQAQYPQQQDYQVQEGPESSQPSNSSSSFAWSHTPSGSGISGYLKAFGKKAVRVAKAGLAQLEHALEGLDQEPQALQQQQQQYSSSGMRTPSSIGANWGPSDVDAADVSNDEALAWAVRLADLPPYAQQQELSHMAPSLRRKVIEVLREQVRSEHEAAAGGPGVNSGLGYGPQSVSSSATAGAVPPPHRHGSPLAQRRQGSQDGTSHVQQHGAPREMISGGLVRSIASHPQPPPAYSDATQHQVTPAQRMQPQSSPTPPPAADLLGIGGAHVLRSPTSAAASTPVPSSGPVVDDLLGFGYHTSAHAPGSQTPIPSSGMAAPDKIAATEWAPPPPPSTIAAVHADDIDDFFSGGKASAVTVGNGSVLVMHGSSSAPNLGSARNGGPGAVGSNSSAAALADMLHGSGDESGAKGGDVDVSDYADLYKGEQGSADEPEIRRRLRAQREAAKHGKMKAALADKIAKEAEEAARREKQVVLKDQYKSDIEAWKNKNKGNIRGLLGSLHKVLWPDSGWAPVSVGDLLEPAQVKRVYMRANLLVHPDKVRQRNGSAEQVAIADMVFDVLKEAWNVFR